MKKRIVVLAICVLLIAQIITMVTAIASFRYSFQNKMEATLKGYINGIELTLGNEYRDYQTIAEEFKTAYGQNIRITFIEQDGTVLADSKAEISSLENHADRSEVIAALQSGFGTDIRNSDTTMAETIYVAKEISGHKVLRLAIPVANIQDIVWQALPVMIIVFIALTILAFFSAELLAKGLTKPFIQLHDSILGYLNGETTTLQFESKYEETEAISQLFENLAKRMNQYLYRAKQESQKSTLILDHISEGLLVLDKDQDVLLINATARKIFNIGKEIDSLNLLHLIRKPEVLKMIDSSFQNNENISFDVQDDINQKTYHYLTSIVPEDAFSSAGKGMLLLISDVTPSGGQQKSS